MSGSNNNPTFTSSTQYVENGDTTTHTTQEDITVTDAQIRWEGVDGYPDSSSQLATVANTNQVSKNPSSDGSYTQPMPSIPPETSTYQESKLIVLVSANDSTITVTVEDNNGDQLGQKDFNQGDARIFTWSDSDTNGNDVTVKYSGVQGSMAIGTNLASTTGSYLEDEGRGHGTATNTKSFSFSGRDSEFTKTLSVSVPSVSQPVVDHRVDISWGGGTEGSWSCDWKIDRDDDGTGDINGDVSFSSIDANYWGGYSEDYSARVPNSVQTGTIDLDMTIDPTTNTDGSVTFSVETKYVQDTTDPSVSGDVSGSYSGSIDDGNWTSWQNLSGLTQGTNNFDHSISGSGAANFEFEYTYEFDAPTPKAIVRVKVSGTIHDLPLVDPSDNALEYGSLRSYVNGEVLAADLVLNSDKDASPARIHTPQHGTLSWRNDIS